MTTQTNTTLVEEAVERARVICESSAHDDWRITGANGNVLTYGDLRAILASLPTDDDDTVFDKELCSVLADCSSFLAGDAWAASGYPEAKELADRCEAMLSQVVAEQRARGDDDDTVERVAIFTPDQVASINGFQAAGFMHPFTCGNNHDGPRELVATIYGFICPCCDYTQDWAHGFMCDWSWKKADPFSAIHTLIGRDK